MNIVDRAKDLASNAAAKAAALMAQPDQPTGADNYVALVQADQAGLQREIDATYAELGKAYYEDHEENADNAVLREELTGKIKSLKTRISEYDGHIAEVAARRRCHACGEQLPEGARFCSRCGAKLPEHPGITRTQPVSRTCPVCKSAVSPSADFCTTCGARLDETGGPASACACAQMDPPAGDDQA